MEIERRALYNLMRMNWLRDPSIAAEPWQVEDYHVLASKVLFERLLAHGLHLDREYFLGLSNEVDTPEELTDLLLEDLDPPPLPTEYDQIYLLLFELWRRFNTDRPCLSIFCDELDHQIHHYDTEKLDNDEHIQDILSNLQTILDENADKGGNPHEVFKLISSNCAHDLESFLFDYICDQLDSNNYTYANELLDGYIRYVEDIKWYDFLRVRLMMLVSNNEDTRYVAQLIDRYGNDKDLEYNLELLGFLTKAGNRELFTKLVKKTLPLISIEADFQDLLEICSDFYHFLDLEPQEKAIRKIVIKRTHIHIESVFNPKDAGVAELLSIL